MGIEEQKEEFNVILENLKKQVTEAKGIDAIIEGMNRIARHITTFYFLDEYNRLSTETILGEFVERFDKIAEEKVRWDELEKELAKYRKKDR